MKHGFVKVAAAAPVIKVADADYNAQQIIETIREAEKMQVKVLVFPHLSITGSCLYDLVSHRVVLEGAKQALVRIIKATRGSDMLVFVGLPFAHGAKIYDCAAAVCGGELLGLVPAETVSNGHFSPAGETVEVELNEDYGTIMSSSMLFESRALPGLLVAAELGADLDAPCPPSTFHAIAGATLIAQLASFPATVSSTKEARSAVSARSKQLSCGMLMAAPGRGESTTDNVFTGLCIAAENGELLSVEEGEAKMAVTEIDIEHLINIRRKRGGFDESNTEYQMCIWGGMPVETSLSRSYRKLPHLPADAADMADYCRRMLDIQVSGLVKRMEYAHLDHCVVGISGGTDSTLTVMVCAMAVRRMGLPPENVIAVTMPCFGTSSRTKSNAIIVAEQCGAEVRVIDIGKSVYQHFDDIGHAHDDYSVAYENAQARERTQILMDISNKVNGLDVGTEDLSEFVDGWCTYNGDHTSMYDVNIGLTKTQVRANLRFIAENTPDKVLAKCLWDVLDCPVTPELLPIKDDKIEQKSEEAVGSYSLQDFFTHKIMICGFTPSKTFRLAKRAYGDEFSDEELVRWLTSYCKRYFSQQFKRSCLMDGPSVEAFSVSPRTGFLIPSDAENAMFLKDLENI